MTDSYAKIAQFKTPAALRARLVQGGLELPVDEKILTAEEHSPLAAPLQMGALRVGNRWCIHPMEGWDANQDGSPSELTLRRWEHIGRSGAKLVWGGEAAAVQPAGRANPQQLLATPANRAGLAQLLERLRQAHRARFGGTDDLVVGLQLTHSGRFSRPHGRQMEPRIAYHHPLLDAKFGIAPQDNSVVWTDAALEQLIDSFVVSAGVAHEVGFHFVDVKACHGYLLHEFLSARCRPGPFGGDWEGRTRVLKTIVRRIRAEYPELAIGVRLSVFDTVPYQRGTTCGEPLPYAQYLPYEYGFGLQADNPLEIDLREPVQLLRELHAAGVVAVNATCGSPYYNPHIQRPALFPPSDGYPPPEDPLVGVHRLIQAARQCHAAVPQLVMVGTGYTYLQDFLPHVAQAVVRAGWIDSVGIGRMLLSYPDLPAECLGRGVLDRKRICRTLSDCTTAPRHGLVSGCYPLDAYYKSRPEADALKRIKETR
jgi:2,4-dienoyl-CoA reductase-like NADH-dependent reductase (Old Yellow Enzyme family)